MASDERIHVGDVGTLLILTIVDLTQVNPDGTHPPLDLTGQTLLEVILEDPSGDSVTKTGVLVGAEVDGVIKYATIAGDLDAPGLWYAQANIAIPNWSGRSTAAAFEVEPAL